MSANNILMYPKHHPKTLVDKATSLRKTFFQPGKPLKFIDDVLGSWYVAVNRLDLDLTIVLTSEETSSTTSTTDRARCLIIDFDHSTPTELVKSSSLACVFDLSADGGDIEQVLPQVLAERTVCPRGVPEIISVFLQLHTAGHTSIHRTCSCSRQDAAASSPATGIRPDA